MGKFSVLMAVYYRDKSKDLQEALCSIYNQTIQPDEVVLVKDGPLISELDCVITNFMKIHDNFKVISLSANVGLGAALNEGLKYCSYNFVARMDSDDISKEERFEKQLGMFEKWPDVDVVGAWIDEFEHKKENVISVRKLPETHAQILKFARHRNPVNHPVVMFRKEAVLKAGNYQHFPLFEDYYLWIRMLMNGSKFYNIPESLLFFRSSPEMYRRRGGWKYIRNEFAFQYRLYQLHFVNFFDFSQNIAIRFVSRILPNTWRGVLYKKVLHK